MGLKLSPLGFTFLCRVGSSAGAWYVAIVKAQFASRFTHLVWADRKVGEPVGGVANRSGSLAVPTEPPTLRFVLFLRVKDFSPKLTEPQTHLLQRVIVQFAGEPMP